MQEAKTDRCELFEVSPKASLADGLSQEMHFSLPELGTIRIVSDDTLPKIAQLAEKIGTTAGAVLDATNVDDFVDALLRHAGNSYNTAAAKTAADMVPYLGVWLTEKEPVHLRARASKLKTIYGNLEAAMTAAASLDGEVDTKIFSVSVPVADARASYGACREKWHREVTANTRVSTTEETLHKSALAALEMAKTRWMTS